MEIADLEVHHQDQQWQIVHQGHHLQLIVGLQVQALIAEAQVQVLIAEAQVQTLIAGLQVHLLQGHLATLQAIIEVHHLHVLQVDLTIQDQAHHQEVEVLVEEDNCNLSNISNPKRAHLSSLFLLNLIKSFFYILIETHKCINERNY